MNVANKQFYDLLEEIIEEQSFELELSNDCTVKCKQLTTAQLKELIKTIDDSPLTQTSFHAAATKIFFECATIPSEYVPTILDRLLFLLAIRNKSVSPTLTMTTDEGDNFTVDIDTVRSSITKTIKENPEAFAKQTYTENKIAVSVETPTLLTEFQLNDEIYKNSSFDVSDKAQIKEFVADFFINEICKYVSSITLNEATTLDFSKQPFQERINIIQKLPTSLMQNVINYIERQKSLIDENLFVNGLYLSIDSTFFTIR